MALPKKRKKLENNLSSGTAASIPPEHADKKKKARTRKSAGTAKKTKSSEQMNKAFEIIEQIESTNGGAQTAAVQDPLSAPPGRIRFRISVDGSAAGPVDMNGKQGAGVDKPREVNFGFTIPSFVWRVPILKKAAEKVLQKLSPQD
jgi:hypothetical protein